MKKFLLIIFLVGLFLISPIAYANNIAEVAPKNTKVYKENNLNLNK